MAKKIFIVFVLFALCQSSGLAQRSRFLYLQTEDFTPFYVQMNGKTISSTAFGYLLLGKLSDTVYPIKLGVMGSNEVQDYGIRLSGRDAGYIIRKSANQGWSITDLQTNASQLSMEYSSAIAAEAARSKAMLAAETQRVSDSIALETAKAVQREKDSVAAATAAAQAAIVPKNDTVNAAVGVVPTAAGASAATSAGKSDMTSAGGKEKESIPAAAVVVPAAIVGAVVANEKDNKATAAQNGKADSIVAMPAKNAQQMRADSIAKAIAQKEQELKELQAALAATAAAGNGDSAQVQQQEASNKSYVAMDTMTQASATKSDTVPKATAAATAVAVGSQAIAGTVTGEKTGNAAIVVAPALLDMEFNMGKDSAAAKKADSVKSGPKPDTLVPAIPAVTEANIVAKNDTVVATAKPPADTLKTVAANTGKVQRQPCSGVVSREELDAAMAKAARLTDADEIISVYKEVFIQKCVTTNNLRKIANTMASDVSKYKLLEAAYPFTLDYYSYADLSNLLQDPYYSNKFKTLIQQ